MVLTTSQKYDILSFRNFDMLLTSELLTPQGSVAIPMDIEDLCELCEPIPKGTSITRFPMKAIKKKVRVETDAVNIIQWTGNGERHFVLVRRPNGGEFGLIFFLLLPETHWSYS